LRLEDSRQENAAFYSEPLDESMVITPRFFNSWTRLAPARASVLSDLEFSSDPPSQTNDPDRGK